MRAALLPLPLGGFLCRDGETVERERQPRAWETGRGFLAAVARRGPLAGVAPGHQPLVPDGRSSHRLRRLAKNL